MSKTTDVAALSLALLLTEAPPRSRSYVYAVDADQAALFADAIAGFVARTPGLSGAVEVAARSVTVRSTGATLTVETSDGASAYGTRPWLSIVDELGVWPTTTNHRRLWSAIISAVPKVPGARLLVIGTAGSPLGLGAEVWKEATASDHWHTSRTPGPSPWWTTTDVQALRTDLTASEWRRLILCEWAESDDALTTPDDVEACIRPGTTSNPHHPSHTYIAALDVGTRRDLTALVVGHEETTPAGRVVVVDRVLTWRPQASEGGRVNLSEVEAAALRICREYRVTRLIFDRMQAEQLTANLSRAGIRTTEFVFSSSGANRLARSLFNALRDRALSLPDDDETRAEFIATRLVETGPGTVKLQNPPGQHDDIVTAVGMIVADLTSKPAPGRGSITVPHGRIGQRSPRPASLEARAELVRLQRTRRAGDALLVPGSANDPGRR